MVEVHYAGRLGNKLFQYTAARLLASNLCLPLRTPFPVNDVLEENPVKEAFPGVDQPVVIINDNNYSLGTFYKPAHYVMTGWFQRSEFYAFQQNKISSFFKLSRPQMNHEDIVMHVRLGDYRWAFESKNRVIHPEWYLKILKRERFKNLFIVTEHNDDPYLGYFKKYDPVIIHGTECHDFHFMRQFSRIISSNSTFSWWASYLSDAQTIYTFKPWIGQKNIDLATFDRAIAIDGEFERDQSA